MIDVAEQKAALSLVDDQPNVTSGTNRPEVLVLGLVDLVQLHPGVDRIKLQVEGGRLGGLLLVAAQAGETVCEGVCDAEVHLSTWERFAVARLLTTAEALRPTERFGQPVLFVWLSPSPDRIATMATR